MLYKISIFIFICVDINVNSQICINFFQMKTRLQQLMTIMEKRVTSALRLVYLLVVVTCIACVLNEWHVKQNTILCYVSVHAVSLE